MRDANADWQYPVPGNLVPGTVVAFSKPNLGKVPLLNMYHAWYQVVSRPWPGIWFGALLRVMYLVIRKIVVNWEIDSIVLRVGS